jgi:hypothetical protein
MATSPNAALGEDNDSISASRRRARTGISPVSMNGKAIIAQFYSFCKPFLKNRQKRLSEIKNHTPTKKARPTKRDVLSGDIAN